MKLLLEHHVLGWRKARRTGEIVAIKHMVFGWISLGEFYALEHIHDASGLLEKFVQGGYLAKQALWNSQATAFGVGIPVGLLFPLVYAKAIADAYNAQNWQNMAYWMIAFFAPFGDLLGILGMGSFLFGFIPGDLRIASPGDCALKKQEAARIRAQGQDPTQYISLAKAAGCDVTGW